MNHIIKQARKNIAYQNKFYTVYDDNVIFPSGREGTYLLVTEPEEGDPVAVLPMCRNHVGLVQTYRYAVGSLQWEIPRGRSHGIDAVGSAKAELAEELGREPDRLHRLGVITPCSSILDSNVTLFLGLYFTPVADPQDTEEIAKVRWIHLVDLQAEIRDGLITDSFTLSAVAYAIINGYFD